MMNFARLPRPNIFVDASVTRGPKHVEAEQVPRPRQGSDAGPRREALEERENQTQDSLTLGQLKSETAGLAAKVKVGRSGR
jgi:hypothetical protein